MRRVPTAVATAILLVAAFVGGVTARSTSTPAFRVVNVGAYGGKPSIVSDTNGHRYDTTPSGGTITYLSTDRGRDWQQVTTADPNSGDDCLATYQANAVYLCSLAGSVAQGKPHAGRIIVGWIAADLPPNATGCNVTMAQAFHTVWVSYSDDGGQTWTPQQAFDAGVGHDTSTPFVAFTLDLQGNPYFGLDVNLSSNPATCSAESTAGAVQSDSSCEYDMYVVWSPDGGATWDGGGGLIPGSAASAYRVNPPAETGTHFFPAI